MTCGKFHTDDPKIEVTIHNLALLAIWRLEFVHACCTIAIEVLKQYIARKSNRQAISQRGFSLDRWVKERKEERKKERKKSETERR